MSLHAWCTACSSPPLSPLSIESITPGLRNVNKPSGLVAPPSSSSPGSRRASASSICRPSSSNTRQSSSSSIRRSGPKSAVATVTVPAAVAAAMAMTASSPIIEPINGYTSRSMDRIKYPPQNRHIWFVTGPAGCGKSTVAKYLADELALPYIEGDDVSFFLSWFSLGLDSWYRLLNSNLDIDFSTLIHHLVATLPRIISPRYHFSSLHISIISASHCHLLISSSSSPSSPHLLHPLHPLLFTSLTIFPVPYICKQGQNGRWSPSDGCRPLGLAHHPPQCRQRLPS